ncbi:hypothetical protein A0256_21220 [Mucilaginibacter sp. PAMC 26640]|nr:hypothetical protein A0256_21220 [Mucilaginibacter sp. PAMC 26640]
MGKALIFFVVLLPALLDFGCSGKKKLYISECNPNIHFKKISLSHLTDSVKFYNKQYVEVSGKYQEGKNVSVLVSDSTFVDHSNKHSLWVNFTQDCPLYLSGTQQGLFSSEDGSYLKLNDHKVTLRGRVEINSKGYSATINEVSAIELY